MRIAIVTSGSRGDVQPYIALGKGLQETGYDVRLLGSSDFESLIAGAGLTFRGMGPNIQAIIENETWSQALEQGHFLLILRQMRTEMKGVAAQLADQLPELLRDSDLILTGMGGIGGVFPIAEHFSIPVMEAYVFPFTATGAFPSPLFSNLPHNSVVNRLSFHLTHQMFWQSSKAVDVAVRAKLGKQRGSFWGPFRGRMKQSSPVLYGYSSAVLPRPSDWEERYHVTGYWFLDEPNDWEPPAELLAFLQAGSPPVYIGFGSMKNRNPQETGMMALEALARSGQRGILASGWGGLQPSDLPDTVHLISAMPHSWLFSRMTAVVHHGGAGTTAAALRAGVPSIVIPFMGDQPFWARRVAELGVGPAPIPRKQLTAERLAEAINRAVVDDAMRRRAADLGRQIRREDGVATAVAIVERHARRCRNNDRG